MVWGSVHQAFVQQALVVGRHHNELQSWVKHFGLRWTRWWGLCPKMTLSLQSYCFMVVTIINGSDCFNDSILFSH